MDAANMPAMVNASQQQQRRQRRPKRLEPLQKIVHASNDRGRHLVATTNLQKGQLIFCERPMICLQSMGNVHAGVLVCQYCMSFCGTPQQSLTISANPTCLAEITTTKTTEKQQQQQQGLEESSSSSSSSSPFALVPCRNYCGHVYCSLECQQDDWMWGGHKELCTGCIKATTKSYQEHVEPATNNHNDSGVGDDDGAETTGNEKKKENEQEQQQHPLLQFKQHAIESNEIFLVLAVWIARIHRHLADKRNKGKLIQTQQQQQQQHSKIDNDKKNCMLGQQQELKLIDPYHPYVDFCMIPWWEVACLPYENDPMGFATAISLEKSLRRLCDTSHGYLQAAWEQQQQQDDENEEEEESNNNNLSLSLSLSSSEWCTPLGMSKLIGSIEQNCVGIRRKHAIRKDIMENIELRHEYHQQLIGCLEQAGMIGDDDDDDDDDNCCGEDYVKDNPDDDDKEVSTTKEEENETENETENQSSYLNENEEWDYTPDEIAGFLAGLSTPLKEGADDEWDALFTPLDGTAMFSTACKMNHSCQPNVILVYKTRGWGQDHPLVAYCLALEDIKAGDELCISYILSDDDYATRQAALVNYGFQCNCSKCEAEKPTTNNNAGTSMAVEPEEASTGIASSTPGLDVADEDDLFGGDDDDDDDDQNQVEHDEADDDEEENGETKLQNLVERFASAENQSDYASIPLQYLAPTSTYVIQLATTLIKDAKEDNKDEINPTTSTKQSAQERRSTLSKLLEQCMTGIRERDFSLCRIVGGDLESTLYTELQTHGSWPDTWYRSAYWCGCLTATIGYAQEGSFLVAMKLLDKAIILGQDRHGPLEELLAYVELYASQMAAGPCPPALPLCHILDYREPEWIEAVTSKGLSQPIRFPVDEWKKEDSNFEGVASQLSSQSTPLVLRAFAKKWPATEKWRDLAGLVQQYGHRLVPIEVGSMSTGTMKEHLVTFRKYVSSYLVPSARKVCWSIEDATSSNNSVTDTNTSSTSTTSSTDASLIPPPVVAYLAQHPLLDQMDALNDDVETEPCGIIPTNVNVWMGTGGTRTPLHFDSYDNLLVQLVGAKYVRLYSPEMTPHLYVVARSSDSHHKKQKEKANGNDDDDDDDDNINNKQQENNTKYGLQGNMSLVDCEIEDFDLHPLARDCPYVEVLLLPGDCLYIPARYWHYARSLSTSISVNYWF